MAFVQIRHGVAEADALKIDATVRPVPLPESRPDGAGLFFETRESPRPQKLYFGFSARLQDNGSIIPVLCMGLFSQFCVQRPCARPSTSPSSLRLLRQIVRKFAEGGD